MDEKEKLEAIKVELDKWFSDEEKSAIETIKHISQIVKQKTKVDWDAYCEQLHDSVNV